MHKGGERLPSFQCPLERTPLVHFMLSGDPNFKRSRALVSLPLNFFFSLPVCLLFCSVFSGGAGLGKLHWGGKFPHVATG